MLEPLRITAYLQSPVICDDRLPLDGVLFYFLAREQFGFQPSDRLKITVDQVGLQDVLKKRWVNVGDRDYWFYSCSFARWVGVVSEGRDHWTKRFDSKLAGLVDFRGKRGRVITQNGKYKGYRMPVYSRHALAVRWYAVGRQGEIERLLSHCTNLGKKESQGYGAILRWEVEGWPQDWSTESPLGLMRALPAETGVFSAFRPSYWAPENQTTCQLPENYADFPA